METEIETIGHIRITRGKGWYRVYGLGNRPVNKRTLKTAREYAQKVDPLIRKLHAKSGTCETCEYCGFTSRL